MTISISVDVTEELGTKFVNELIKIVKKILEKLKKDGKLDEESERSNRMIGREEVNPEIIELAETKTCNILQGVIRAFRTLGINPKEKGVQNLYVSKTGRITTSNQIYLSPKKVKKLNELGILRGSKRRKFESNKRVRYIRLVDDYKGICKLPKKEIEIIKRIVNTQSHYKYPNLVCYTKIKKYKRIVEVIEKNRPRELEDEYKFLIKAGKEVDLNPKYVYVAKNGKIISAIWHLFSKEGHEEYG